MIGVQYMKLDLYMVFKFHLQSCTGLELQSEAISYGEIHMAQCLDFDCSLVLSCSRNMASGL
jgi:hypothetical protein